MVFLKASFIFFVLLLLLNVYAFGSVVCETKSIKSGKTQKECIVINDKKRHYRLFVPKDYKGKKLSLIIGFHGGGGSAKSFERYSRFSALSQHTKKFIVVYPEGVDKYWNDGRKNVNANVDDVAFIEKLIKHLRKRFSIQKKKVYAVGMSNGGLMALRLGCESALVYGMGVVAATMPTHLIKQCKNISKPIAFIFGSEDSAFLNDGRHVSPVNQKKLRGYHLGIEKSFAYWEKQNVCKEKLSKISVTDNHHRKFGRFKDDHTIVATKTYKKCREKVIWYDVKGGGHRWADPEAGNGFIIRKTLNLGWASHEISSAGKLWEFFEEQ